MLFSAVALAGLVATAVAPSVAEPGIAGGHDPFCPPEQSSAARTETERDRPHEITAEQAADYDRQLRAASRDSQAPDDSGPWTVPIVVHVISHEDGQGDLDDAIIDRQVSVMNKAFKGGYGGADTGFRFTLAEVVRSENSSWFDRFSRHERDIKSRLRQGGAETLNLYMADLGGAVLGTATFPQQYRTAPKADGVVVDYRSLPGGGRTNFENGYTAVHETGHWLGLFHTFQNGCSSPGDYVADTAYERERPTGCPKGRDTCPHRAGEDPVHNFMNYSDDPCLNHFTEGQGQRMAQHWTAFRE
ncbi:MAG: zinc metalloprotease [Nocardiopsaceae bacterium]|nr:zinc metalloprotease [Nocardiopsaceae bacterium]